MAGYLGVEEGEVGDNGVFVSTADLEEECVRGLGPVRYAQLLDGTPFFNVQTMQGHAGVASPDELPLDYVAETARSQKIEAALSLRGQMTPAEGQSIHSVREAVACILGKLAG